MRYFLVLIIGLALPYMAISQEVVSSAGDSYSNSSLQADFTIGEVVIESISTADIVFTQGFQQPMLSTVLAIDKEVYNIEIYPNPVKQFLRIELSNPTHDIKYHLVDIQGNIIDRGDLHESETPISFMDQQPGIYFLVLSNADYQLKTYKIIKVN